MTYEEAVKTYQPTLGLEVHVELNTATKAFDDSPQEFLAEPNMSVNEVSVGLPGTLPVFNEKALESAIRLGLALNCKIAEETFFARKHYFYPDLPKAYQISQSSAPIAYDGYVDVELSDGATYRVEIERAHMEEDAGKLNHVGGGTRIHGADYSLVDYNRSSVPLVEIVSRPFTEGGERSAEIAAAYVQTLRDIFRALNISEARMERGNVRADVNVSLRKSADDPLGTRTETKNVNSFRSVDRAVRFEVARQAERLNAGESIVQETRHFHEADGTTSSGRPKSDADDYRYFPDPDLPPMVPDREWIEQLRAELPELPAAKRHRLQDEWAMTDLEMRDIVSSGALELVEATVLAGSSPAAARKWWNGEIAKHARSAGIALEDAPVTPQQVAALQVLVDDGKLTDSLARQALEGVLAGEGEPHEVVAARGLEVVSDEGALQAAVAEVIASNPDAVAKIKAGKVQAIGALVGGVMKATRGQADAAKVKALIAQTLEVE
ncbi:Asp-tRNA(Asn)/Glu-tRNA(Gln) amidotransferase subunit GatB [Actinomyces minihominis]|uniref:Asp-tRNA(Asn)/Glu-tRNA(Gln) amidotransferase subunit GatB n=1 Tax=Actinomyces minihominis TaxID=2002838 RepID=UPI000C0792E5|nr:Asp-tRNA(Asn)/Glu-tRNA(Gln) amidotransferase subunit GatB [Actinomyces minihominis]